MSLNAASVDAYRRRQAKLDELVGAALERHFSTLDLSDPEGVRNELLVFVPALVERFGPVAAEVAAEWYDELAAEDGSSFGATAVESAGDQSEIAREVRYKAGALWGENPAILAALLVPLVGKWVRQWGRDTTAANAAVEGVLWARVPTGGKTCSWCLTLASESASSPHAESASDAEKYHGDCDCEAVRLSSKADYPKGFLPDDFQSMYSKAVKAAGTDNPKEVATAMRQLFPDAVNDGAHTH